MERVKNAALVFCLFIVLLVIFSSYFRANEVGTFFGALAVTSSAISLNEWTFPVAILRDPVLRRSMTRAMSSATSSIDT